MGKKGIEFTSSTIAILILGLIFFVLALTFTTKGNQIIAYFERNIAGRSPKAAYSNFIRHCRLACTTADGSFNPEKDPENYTYCSITMNTTSLGGYKNDSCYDETQGVANVTCKIKTVNGEPCNLGNGCGSCD